LNIRTGTLLEGFSYAVGLSAILLPTNLIFMRSSLSRQISAVRLTSLVWATIFDLLIVGMLFGVVLILLRCTRLWPVWKLFLAAVLAPFLVYRSPMVTHEQVRLASVLLFAVVWAGLLCVVHHYRPRIYNLVIQWGRVILGGFGIFVLLTCAQLLRAALWNPGPQEIRTDKFTLPQSPNAAAHPLIVWVVFDELSFDQLFDHRASDLRLPQFDAMRAQSTLYTRVQPIGYYTKTVLPSLFLGDRISEGEFSYSNQLYVRTEGNGSWHVFDAQKTIFAEAHTYGWKTAIVGWFNPYCPILEGAVDSCYWVGWDNFDGPMSTDVSVWQNTVFPLQILTEKWLAPKKEERDKVSFQVERRLKSYRDLHSRSLALLNSSDADFIFLHLPVPHPPSIYDRHTGEFVHVSGQSYLDSLALADRTLGDFMAVLQASPRWPETTVIVMGDHSWRLGLWEYHDGWTAEDERASGGAFDPRPALLIHMAGQTTAGRATQEFSLLKLHDVISGILKSAATDSRR